MNTSQISAYSALSDTVNLFINEYDLNNVVRTVKFKTFIEMSIKLCSKSSDTSDASHSTNTSLHLEYLKNKFPEIHFLCMLYLQHSDSGSGVTEQKLDDYCYSALRALSERISNIASSPVVRSVDTIDMWGFHYKSYITTFFRYWWTLMTTQYTNQLDSDYLSNRTIEQERTLRVYRRLIKNNVPFQSVMINSILQYGVYSNCSGLNCVYIASNLGGDIEGTKFVVKNSTVDTDTFTKSLMMEVTQEYLDNDTTNMIMWLYKISEIKYSDMNPNNTTNTFIVAPLVFFYLNNDTEVFNNIHESLWNAIRNKDDRINPIDILVTSIDNIYRNIISTKENKKVMPPEGVRKYINYLKIKRKVSYR